MAQDQTLPIGKLAAETGVKVPTIRYYESVDLLPAPLRTGSNRRTYDARDVRRVSFIRHARELASCSRSPMNRSGPANRLMPLPAPTSPTLKPKSLVFSFCNRK